MKLGELADSIFLGKLIERNDLTTSPTNYLYLTPDIIKNTFISEEKALYLTEKVGRRISTNEVVAYGDIVISRKTDGDFIIFRIVQEFTKYIVASPQIVVIKSPNSFLSNLIQHESGRSYLKAEILDVAKHKDNNWKNIASQVKEIDLPLSFDNGEISVSPGNIPIDKDDFAKISIRKGIISTDNLIKRIGLNEIKIEGYFQRKSKLWDEGTKSRLIETVILEIPIPPLYFDIVSKGEWLIIDGLQRITTINDFFNNKFRLQELDFLPELNGKTFEELDRNMQRSIEEAELTTFSIQPGTPRTVRYKIFKNINTSALILNRQEIRHAMNDDEQVAGLTPSKYVKELADILNEFIVINEGDKDRMYDRELALRYVTFRMFYYKADYKPSMADFLDYSMENMYSYPANRLELYKTDFRQILDILTQIFDSDVLFTRRMIAGREDDGEPRKVINGSLLEIWTYAVSQLSKEEKGKLNIRKKDILERTKSLKNDVNFLRSIDPRYFNSIEMVKTRFATIIDLINDIKNDN